MVVVFALGFVCANCNFTLAHTDDNFLELEFQAYHAPFGFDQGETYTEVWGADGFAYLGSLGSGVAIVDFQDPRSISTVGNYGADLDDEFHDIRIVESTGFFSANNSGTHLVDISKPDQPALLSVVSAASQGFDSVTNATVYGDYLFQVSSTSSQIAVTKISNRTSPQFATRIETGDSVGIYDLTILDDRLYAAGLGGESGNGAAYLFDIAELVAGNHAAASANLIATVATGANTASVWPNDEHSILMTTQRRPGGGVTAWDISTPTEAKVIDATNASDFGINAFSAGQLFVLDNLVYTAWHQAGVQVLDLNLLEASDTIFRVGAFETSDASPLERYVGNTSVHPVSHEQVLLADSEWGLHLVDASVVLSVPSQGDFDGDLTLSVGDLDLLTVEVQSGANLQAFDLNEDGTVDNSDREAWVVDLFGTWIGDSNLDGEFNSTDFVAVFINGEYEDQIVGNSSWSDGDWDGNGDFESADFVYSFIDGGYEQGQRIDLASVPEPSHGWLSFFLILGFGRRLPFARRK